MSMFTRHRVVLGSLILLAAGAAHATGVGEPTPAVPPHAQLTQFLLQSVEDPNQLRGYRIGIVAADGVDGFDLEIPRHFLAERGATVHVLVPRPNGVLQATGSGAVIKPKTDIAVLNPSGEEETSSFDRFLDQVQAADYDVIYLPGNRMPSGEWDGKTSIAFLQDAARSGVSIFAIANSSMVLLKAGLLDDRRATGDPATLLALASSKATVADAALVEDGVIRTSRDAFDMPALMDGLIATLLARPATLSQ